MKYLFLFISLSFFSLQMSAQDKASKETSKITILEKAPIFPGCNSIKSNSMLKKCLGKGVRRHFSKKFKSSLPNRVGLKSGRYKIYIGFVIDKNGDIRNINVKSPHPKITKECKRVIASLPKIIPGTQRGENVNVKYTIPFTIVVKESRKQRRRRGMFSNY